MKIKLATQEQIETLKEDYTTQRQQDQLKVATVEKELNDYKSTMAGLNPNQEAKQKATGYGIVSLPKNAANGQISSSVKGNTRTNLLTENQASVETDTTGFIGVGANITRDTTEKLFGNASLKTATNGVNIDEGVVHSSVNVQPNKTYVASAYVKGSGTVKMILFERTSGNSLIGQTFTEVITLTNNWQRVSVVRTFGTGGEKARFQLSTDVAQTITFYVDGLIIEEGSVLNNWITGTKSTISASRVKSVGKNLLPHKEGVQSFKDWTPQLSEKFKIEGEYFNQVGSGSVYSKPFYLEKGDYNIQLFGQAMGGTSYSFSMVDINNKVVGTVRYISTTLTTYNHAINVADKGMYRLRILSGGVDVTAKFKDVSIEKGTLATPYEPYTESTQYLPNVGELRSLPNGVRDEIKVSGGKAELVKRVSDTMEELAEPIVTPIEVSGTLLSYPSGTVYVEKVFADAGIYDSGINVLYQDLLIDYVEKLSKVDFTTGLETELDVSKVVLSEDKKGFTHPDLSGGDIIFFTYYHNLESTLGETTIEYYDSRHTLKDDVSGKFYKIVPKISDGVLTNELVEV